MSNDERTLCWMTNAAAVGGACPIHRGDACLERFPIPASPSHRDTLAGEPERCAACGNLETDAIHRTQPFTRPSSSSSPSESLAQPEPRLMLSDLVTMAKQRDADAELGALLRAAMAEAKSKGEVLVVAGDGSAWLFDDYAESDNETDATRALSSALSRTARAGAQGGER